MEGEVRIDHGNPEFLPLLSAQPQLAFFTAGHSLKLIHSSPFHARMLTRQSPLQVLFVGWPYGLFA